MHTHIFKAFLGLSTLSLVRGYDGSRHLWYNTPGTEFNEGLAIGNGRIGALILGSATETIILNENSVWNGTFQDRINNASLEAFPVVRQLLRDGNLTEAGNLVLENMSANPTVNRAYSVTNNLVIDLGHSEGDWENYERWLDTLQGNVGVSYTIGSITYSREVIAHFDSGIIAVRLNASGKGALNVKVGLSRSRGILWQGAAIENNTVTQNVGGSDAGSIAFSSGVRVVTDGDISTNGTSLTISGATAIDLFYDAETEFQWPSQVLYEESVANKLVAAVSSGFDNLKSEAIEDHAELIGRVKLDFGSSGDVGLLSTVERIANYKEDPDADPEFVALTYQFGRHLLVAASRDTGGNLLGVPANLQGIWNDNYLPPWGGKYTVNINTEMNYWLAESTNLIETLPPLWDLMARARDRGKEVAQRMYGCPGYVSHHNHDVFGDSAPHDNGTQWTMWPMSNLWLLSHMMEHYRFTGDQTFLKETAWDLFYDAATFWNCYLFEFDGHTSSGPSISPENSFVIPNNMSVEGKDASIDISPTLDTSLLREFLSNILIIASDLGIALAGDAVLSNVQSLLDRLRPAEIGKYGQIQEWRLDYEEAAPDHRHISHLWDLFPNSRFTPLVNKTLADAARVSIERRLAAGGAATGWSRSWVAACFARLLDGDQSYNQTQLLLQGHVMTNMFHMINVGSNLFQIDSNFGVVAAITESLLQSHAGLVHLLPALAQKVPKGSITKLVARGGFEVTISWEDGALAEASIYSRLGSPLAVKVANGVDFKINGESIKSIETTAGTTYTITLT
ncbi:putative alpha-L-fucosidase 2 precursor [Truncatella angustata]|uniref:Alpha-L-fucosidase 2 n=1 Tax=Truncatella angustata TaxID=152316 RepID=A0A9P8UQ03_9PEZI|nr:putative alpha-L-fucosidase 2 precursor [Truncatella angustata]KAH6656830.1 putative alpha-L-fucosidase 2 precursor [Truncatella angustata]